MHASLVKADRTLASLAPGESGTVSQIVFGALRALCDDLGIREGDAVRCRAGTAGVLILDTEDGHTVSLARDWARFIRLGTVAAPSH
ncbi:MAG TPA: FeoA domain-containing protein [Longimicrobiales bacterium]